MRPGACPIIRGGRIASVAGLVLAATVAIPAAAPARAAGVEITVDRKTLSDLLAAMVPPSVSVPLGGQAAVTLRIDGLEVTGFDPSAGETGQVRTSLRLEVPELGVRVPVRPRLSLHLSEKDGRSLCYLAFEHVVVPLPLGGPVDIAHLLPRIPVPADEVHLVQLSRGAFRVRTRLVKARMGSNARQLGFDLDVSPAP
jgi:hypothetical protein